MNPMKRPQHYYPLADSRPESAPDYDRAVRALSDADLEDEILGGRGEPGFRAALIAEQDRRAKAGPPDPMPVRTYDVVDGVLQVDTMRES